MKKGRYSWAPWQWSGRAERDTARAMSDQDQETIIIMRRLYEALNREDFDGAVEIVHPEVEFLRPGVESPVRGAGALRAWLEPDALVDQR